MAGKIPKSLKKQIRNNLNINRETKTMRRTWSYAMGDLVKIKSDKTWGIVIGCFDTHYCVMTSGGQKTLYPRQLERVQPVTKDDI